MNKTRVFPVDNASILFLSLIKPWHTNSFRFSMTLHDPIEPALLQQAVDRITPRFPSVIAGLRQDFFRYVQVSAAQPPKVQPDPGILKPMTAQELKTCCFRVYYRENTVSIEAFHALTDGYGAITTLTTLVGEYLTLYKGIFVAPSLTRLDISAPPQSEETDDPYPSHASAKPRHLPSRFSYLLPRPEDADWTVRTSACSLDTGPLLDAAHRYGVTLNTLLTTVLAKTVMDMQAEQLPERKHKPVRIMIAADMRRPLNSRSLRNFSLYALPTMEAHQKDMPMEALCQSFQAQLKEQLSMDTLLPLLSYNVRTQNAWYFRIIPWKLKSALLRLGYRFFGESNSSLTLTNLGSIRLPEALVPHVADFQCWLTPRVTSPYGCTVMSYADKLTLNMSRFTKEDVLGTRFFDNLQRVVKG